MMLLVLLLNIPIVFAHQEKFFCRKCGKEITWSPSVIDEVPDEMVHEHSVRDTEGGISIRVSNDFEKIVYVENAKNVNIKKSVDNSMSNGDLDWKRATCAQCSHFLGWALEDSSEELYGSVSNDANIDRRLVDTCLSPDDIPQDTCESIKVGYWHVLWCHRNTIQQMHLDHRGKPDSIFSLGTYDTLNSDHEDEKEDEVFVNGQICDETGKSRMTTVHFECCSSEQKKLSIRRFEEPEMCRYKLVVCLPERKSFLSSTSSSSNAKKCSVENLKNCALSNQGDVTHRSYPNYRYALLSSHLISSEEMTWIEEAKPMDSI